MKKIISISLLAVGLTFSLSACDETIEKSKESLDINTEHETAVENWNDYKNDMLDHYEDANVLDIQASEEMDYMVFNIIVPNEFKMNYETEKEYYVEEVGPMIQEDLHAHFHTDIDQLIVYFKYEDGNTMAKTETFGSNWNIK